jgi:D-alanine--D-alanine ligase
MSSILLICGGPSPEKGISLNSARSVMDHLIDYFDISALYINDKLQFFPIDCNQLYSNRPEDFDFQLHNTNLTGENLAKFLKSFDLIFPLVHGKFGEDGQLQALLESLNVPFVGSSSTTCSKGFNKFSFNQFLKKEGFDVLQAYLVNKQNITSIGCNFTRPWVVKPTKCGSSFGVEIVRNYLELQNAMDKIFNAELDDQVIVEEFVQGLEFTLVILEGPTGNPVPLIPTEVEILSDSIFDYRKKYLPSSSTRSHCPPRLSHEVIQSIREKAAKIFQLLSSKDLVRIDGWVLKSGEIVFTDLNPMSGMEQNSFLFQQAAWIGFTHSELLVYLVNIASKRYNLKLIPKQVIKFTQGTNLYILFGGNSNEKQISIMSGTNVWLKLMHSQVYNPKLFLLVGDEVFLVPYPYSLYHTVEEIYENCQSAVEQTKIITPFIVEINQLLKRAFSPCTVPQLFDLDSFIALAKEENAFVFLALHGGFGEDGSIQSLLENTGLLFNGSNAQTSAICMNKYTTADMLQYNDTLIKLQKIQCRLYKSTFITKENQPISYKLLVEVLQSKSFIIKPIADGCSTGVYPIHEEQDLIHYLQYIKSTNDSNLIYIIEPFIRVDEILITNKQLQIVDNGGWIEMTVGILITQGNYYSLNPSITIASAEILSLEEKFQGGTGINLTPPPSNIINQSQIALIKQEVEKIGKQLKLDNYARIDIFFNRKLNQLMVIEVNTLPALTPSTVLFHQAIAENPPIKPKNFLEQIINNVVLQKNVL